MSNLRIRVHEKNDDVFDPPEKVRNTWLWIDKAMRVLKGELDGDKEKALEIVTYWRGDWIVSLPRRAHVPFIVRMPNCSTEKEAIKKAKNYAERKHKVYDIDDTKPATAVRRLLDEDELPDEYKCPAEYKDIY